MSDILEKLAQKVDNISEDEVSGEVSKNSLKENLSKEKNSEPTEDGSAMDKLLISDDIVFPKIGDTVEGTVIDVSSNEIYLDLTPFGTGVVLGREIKDGMGSGKIKVGDKVSATLVEIENEDGFIELSIREASYEKAWDDIENKLSEKEKISTKIVGANKGGLLVEVNGISGFLPVSQLSSQNYPRVEDGDRNKILSMLKKLVGKEMEVRILDADREAEKLIVSEKAAQSEKEREVISSLKKGDVISGEISGVVDFGAFIKFSPQKESSDGENKLEGLVHISELAWQLIEDPRTIVKVGDKVSAKIIGIDADKISLSIRALAEDPWSKVKEKYSVGDVVSGKVHKINHFGAFVYLDKDIHGLAHISEMAESYPGKTMDQLIKLGQDYLWTILSIEPRDHRMGLVLADKKTSQKKEKKEDKKKEEVKKEAVKDKKEEAEKKPVAKKEKKESKKADKKKEEKKKTTKAKKEKK